MKIAVTGGSGQLGTALLRRLLRDRTVKQVVNLDLQPPALPGYKLTSVKADVRDPDIGRHLEGCQVLIHLAFVVTDKRPRAEVDSINIDGSKNVFTAAAAAGVSQIIYSSSIAAYGVVHGHKLPLVEETPRIFQPEFAYAATKYQVEAFLDEFEAAHPALLVTRLRPSILIGPVMHHPLGQSLRHRTLFSTGTVPMPIVWDDDVAEAIVLCLRKRARGAFNLCADELLPPRELAREVGFHHVGVGQGTLSVLGRLGALLERFGLLSPPDPEWLKGGQVNMTASSKKAREVLGWNPAYPTATAVMRHYDAVGPSRLDLRLRGFFGAVGWAARNSPPRPELAGLSERIHLQLTGKTGGDLGILVDNCRIQLTPQPPQSPTAVLSLGAELLLDILAGRTDLGAAQLTGRLRVDGEPRAAMVLGGLLAAFRQSDKLPGVAGLFGRGLQAWVRH